MSNDEIERRLQEVVLVAPRDGLREDVLDRVRAELRMASVPRIDRFLARRAPWAVAAALLFALVGANLLLQRRASSKRDARRAAIESDARSMVEFRAWISQRVPGDWR